MVDFLDKEELSLPEEVADLAARAMIKWARQQAHLMQLVDIQLSPDMQLYPKGYDEKE